MADALVHVWYVLLAGTLTLVTGGSAWWAHTQSTAYEALVRAESKRGWDDTHPAADAEAAWGVFGFVLGLICAASTVACVFQLAAAGEALIRLVAP